jgi:hypothetical protein
LQGCHFCSIIVGAVVGCTGEHGGRQFSGDRNGPIYISIAMLDTDAGTFLLTLFPCEESSIFSHDQILSDYPLQLRPVTGITYSSHRFSGLTYSREPWGHKN